MKHEEEKGTAGLEGDGKKREPKKGEREGEKGKKEAKKKGPRLAEMRIRPLHDGSYHIEHHHEDKNGMPHPRVHEYSAATKEDLHDHVEEHMPEDGQDEEAEGEEGDGGEAQGAGAQPGASAGAPAGGAPGQDEE